MKIRSLTFALATFVLLALPSAASAAEYFATSSAEITSAINAAAVSLSDDTVHIAPGNYTIDKNTFPNAGGGSGKLDIEGAGVGQTVLSGSVNNTDGRLIYLALPTSSSTFSDFTLNVQFTSPNFLAGLQMGTGGISDFAVNQTGSPTANSAVAVQMDAGDRVVNGTITTNGTVTGLSTSSLNNVVRDVSIGGTANANSIGLRANLDSSGTYERLRISGFDTAVYFDGGSGALTDSLIDMGSLTGSRAVVVNDQNSSQPSSTNVHIYRDTIVGTGNGQSAVFAGMNEGIDTVDLELYDTVIYGTGTSLAALGCSGANTTVEYDQIRYAGTIVCTPDNSPGDTAALVASPFKNFAGGDYSLSWNSELVDAGATTPETNLDLAQKPRVVDGDGSGTATVDIGAFEYQRGAPTVTIQPHKANIKPLEGITFTADATDPDGEVITYAWTIDGVPSLQNPQSLGLSFIVKGLHTITVTATDEAGATGTATTTVTVGDDEVYCPAILKGLTLGAKPKKAFVRTGKGFGAPKKGKAYFTLGIASGVERVTFTMQSVSKSKKLKTVKGSQTVKVSTSLKKFGFGGHFGGKNLKPGKYKVTATPLSSYECPPTLKATVTITLK